MILWNGVPGNITAPPGQYYARLRVGKDSVEVPFVIKADPNYKTTQTEYEAQFAFLNQVREKFNETQKAIKDIRALRTQINGFVRCKVRMCPKKSNLCLIVSTGSLLPLKKHYTRQRPRVVRMY
jgi:hypothetical protein